MDSAVITKAFGEISTEITSVVTTVLPLALGVMATVTGANVAMKLVKRFIGRAV